MKQNLSAIVCSYLRRGREVPLVLFDNRTDTLPRREDMHSLPHVLALLNLTHPDVFGQIAHIKGAFPDSRIIVFTNGMPRDNPQLIAACRAGGSCLDAVLDLPATIEQALEVIKQNERL